MAAYAMQNYQYFSSLTAAVSQAREGAMLTSTSPLAWASTGPGSMASPLAGAAATLSDSFGAPVNVTELGRGGEGSVDSRTTSLLAHKYGMSSAATQRRQTAGPQFRRRRRSSTSTSLNPLHMD